MPEPIGWDPFDFVFNQWMDTIEEQTGGRVKFERYPAETLIKLPDMWDAVTTGTIDIGNINDCAFPGQFPLTVALRLPGLFENSRQGGIVKQMLLDEGYLGHEWDSVKVLYMSCSEPWDVCSRVKQIRTLEDMKGLKVAAVGEPELSILGALGAVPVGMSPMDFYIALERGTVDAAWQDVNGHVSFRLYDVAPYSTRTPLNGGASVCAFVMNKDKYNSLPADIKEVFDRNTGLPWVIINGRRFDSNYEKCMAFLSEREGIPPVYTLPPEEQTRWFEQASGPVIEGVLADLEAKGLPASEMFDRAHELIERVRSWGF